MDPLLYNIDDAEREIERLNRIVRGYRHILEEAGVDILHFDIDVEALIRVARAAKAIEPYGKEDAVNELLEALAEVEDLL